MRKQQHFSSSLAPSCVSSTANISLPPNLQPPNTLRTKGISYSSFRKKVSASARKGNRWVHVVRKYAVALIGKSFPYFHTFASHLLKKIWPIFNQLVNICLFVFIVFGPSHIGKLFISSCVKYYELHNQHKICFSDIEQYEWGFLAKEWGWKEIRKLCPPLLFFLLWL